jgi:hypothetical protein
MNEAALHQIVQRRNQDLNRCLARCFTLEITVGLVCFAVMLAYAGILAFGDPGWLISPRGKSVTPTRLDILSLLVAGGIWFYYSAYMYRARKRQQRRVEVFDSTLRGDLDRALSQTDFQITMLRKITWWGLVPSGGGNDDLDGCSLSSEEFTGLGLSVYDRDRLWIAGSRNCK